MTPKSSLCFLVHEETYTILKNCTQTKWQSSTWKKDDFRLPGADVTNWKKNAAPRTTDKIKLF